MPGELVLQTLRHVWQTLKPLNVPMAVIGGLALAAWKHIRATKDIDLLLGIGADELDPVLRQLQAAGMRPKHSPPLTILGRLELVQLLYEPPEALMDLQVDLLLANSEYHREALSRRIPTTLPGLEAEIAVLACEDLILHKLLAGRLIDRADAVALLRLNRETLDFDYINRWADSSESPPGTGRGLATKRFPARRTGCQPVQADWQRLTSVTKLPLARSNDRGTTRRERADEGGRRGRSQAVGAGGGRSIRGPPVAVRRPAVGR